MKKLLLLAMLALLGAFAATGPIEALASPISPVHPPGLEDCPRTCIENVTSVGYPTCNAWCVEMYGLVIAAEYISPRRPAVAILECPRSGWWQAAPWMGQYELWTDGAGYCVGKRL